jgi:NAD(P)H-dependent FMN reductase
MPRLMIIIGSTRPGRIGLPIAEWFIELAGERGSFEVDVADLAEIDLPFLDEANHPALGKYEKPHTLAWSEQVSAADAFVLVTPEYNFSMTAPVKNAFDFLFREWHYKPIGFVSYGAVSGGIRAVQQLKQVTTTLSMMPINQAVVLQNAKQMFDDDGVFVPTEQAEKAAVAMLGELRRWSDALTPLRATS